MKRAFNFLKNVFLNYVSIVIIGIAIGFLVTEWKVGIFLIVGSLILTLIDRPKPERIKVKYFDGEIEKLEKIAFGDWIDLRSAANVDLEEGESCIIPLGVGMILPDGYEAHVVPRSSTPEKFGIVLANSIGIIDNSYSGDLDQWHFPAVAIRQTRIRKGDRIAQFRIVENQPPIEFETVEHLNDTSRGGLGSTGKR